MSVIVIASGKGGVGKSTTAAEVAYWTAQQGRTCLVVDCDEQGNVSTRCGMTADTEINGTAADVIQGASALECATPSPIMPGVDVLVGTHDLTVIGREPQHIIGLREHLPTLGERWDTIVIDTPPNLGIVTLGALAAADTIVAVAMCAGESVDQLLRLDEVIKDQIRPRLNSGARIDAVLPTHYTRRVTLNEGAIAQLRNDWPGIVAPAIRAGVAAKESFLAGQPVSAYDPSCGVAIDYKTALDHMLTGKPVATTAS